MQDHEFGAQHTEIKLEVVRGYLEAYMTALRGKWKNLWYIDAFAGTGHRTVKTESRAGTLFDAPVTASIEQRRGSASIALDIVPQFDRLVFMEQNPKHCAALLELKQLHPSRQIDIVEGDANQLIQREIGWSGWRSTRAVMFLDPYGMTVEWDTLRAIASTKAIDVWYLFSLSGLYRQAARNASAIDEKKRSAITRMLGTNEWLNRLYAPTREADLLSGVQDDPTTEQLQRVEDVRGLEAYVQRRLREIFPTVLDPLQLPVRQRPQKFSLFFAVSNPDHKATGLATKFATSVIRRGRSYGG